MPRVYVTYNMLGILLRVIPSRMACRLCNARIFIFFVIVLITIVFFRNKVAYSISSDQQHAKQFRALKELSKQRFFTAKNLSHLWANACRGSTTHNFSRVPILDPWGLESMRFYKKQAPLLCKSKLPKFAIVAKHQLLQLKYPKLTCKYRCMEWMFPAKRAAYGGWKSARNGTNIPCDCFQLVCERPGQGVNRYDAIHRQLNPKPISRYYEFLNVDQQMES